MKLNKKEKIAINRLRRLAENWPKSLWLFSGSGSLCVMKFGRDGKRVIDEQGCFDSKYIVDIIDIPNDGGDW